jgi:hypothetical protein
MLGGMPCVKEHLMRTFKSLWLITYYRYITFLIMNINNQFLFIYETRRSTYVKKKISVTIATLYLHLDPPMLVQERERHNELVADVCA